MGARFFGAAAAVGLLAAMTVTPASGQTASPTGQPAAVELAAWSGFGRYVAGAATVTPGAAGMYSTNVDGEHRDAVRSDRPPFEADLRNFALIPANDGIVASLQFHTPVGQLTDFEGRPVKHVVSVIFESPSGQRVTLSTDDTSTAFAFFGNQVLIAVPASLGIAADWDARPFVSIHFTDTNLGWESGMPFASVGSLTGDAPGGLPFSAHPNAAPSASTLPWDDASAGTGAKPTSVRLVQSGAELDAVVHFDGDVTSAGNVTLTFFPPDDHGASTPLLLEWKHQAGQAPPQGAFLSTPTERGVASVPARINGNDLVIDLSKSTPIASTRTPANTPAPSTLNLDGAFDLDQTKGVIPNGQNGLTLVHWKFLIQGTNVAVQDVATGATALGYVDLTSGDFVAYGEADMWGGRLGGNSTSLEVFASHEHLVDAASGTGLGAPVGAQPIAFRADDPLTSFVKQAGNALRRLIDRFFPPKPSPAPKETPPVPQTVEDKEVLPSPPGDELKIKFQDASPFLDPPKPGIILENPPLQPPPIDLLLPPLDPPFPVILPPTTSAPTSDPALPDFPFPDLNPKKPPVRKRWSLCAQSSGGAAGTGVLTTPCVSADVLLAASGGTAAGSATGATSSPGGSSGTSATPFVIGGVAAGAAIGFLLYRRRAQGAG